MLLLDLTLTKKKEEELDYFLEQTQLRRTLQVNLIGAKDRYTPEL